MLLYTCLIIIIGFHLCPMKCWTTSAISVASCFSQDGVAKCTPIPAYLPGLGISLFPHLLSAQAFPTALTFNHGQVKWIYTPPTTVSAEYQPY